MYSSILVGVIKKHKRKTLKIEFKIAWLEGNLNVFFFYFSMTLSIICQTLYSCSHITHSEIKKKIKNFL